MCGRPLRCKGEMIDGRAELGAVMYPACLCGLVAAGPDEVRHLSSASHHRDVGGVDGLHADDVIAAIDVMDLAADPGRKIAQQIKTSATDIFDRDVALQ